MLAAALVYLGMTYLVASIPFGLVVTTLRGGHLDVRAEGSGNIGTTNVARLYGWSVALIVLVFDVAKGALPVLYAQAMAADGDPFTPGASVVWLATVGFAAFLGHCFPIYLGFSGGKGVATAAGVMLVIAPVATLGAGAVWLIALLLTKRSSLASLFAVGALVGLLAGDGERFRVAAVLAVCIVLTHTSNLRRLMTGTESAVVGSVRWGRTPEPSRAEIEAMLHEPPAGSSSTVAQERG